MRPVSLTLDFFGPYRHQKVDFTKFNDFPLFLISGKTGAGKTTLFDAMSYALFGRTSGDQREPKQMRSDFATTEDQTAVEFVFTHDHKRYVVTRQPEQLIAKKRGDGNRVQNSKSKLAVFDGDEQIDEKIKTTQVDKYIQDLLHLTPDQFMQIILLPQGQFRDFLIAPSDEKEKILRDLFNTRLYQSWQLALKDKHKEMTDQIQNQLGQITTYQNQLTWQETPENLADLTTTEVLDLQAVELKNLKTTANELKKAYETSQKTLDKYNVSVNEAKNLTAQFEMVDQLNQKLNELNQTQPEIDQKQALIDSLTFADGLKTEYKQRADYQKDLKHNQQETGELQTALQTQTQTVTSLKKIKQDLVAQEFLIKQKRDQLATLREKKDLYASVDALNQQLSLTNNQLNQATKIQTDLNQQLKSQTEQQALAKKTISSEPELLNKRTTLVQKINATHQNYENLAQLIKQQTSLQELVQDQTQLQVKVDESIEIKNQLQEVFDDLNDQYARQQIARLAQNLKPGSPCPVCGATDHPKLAHVAVETKPVSDEQVETAQTKLTKAVEKAASLSGELNEKQEQIKQKNDAFQADLKQFKITADDLVQTYQTVGNDLTELKDQSESLNEQLDQISEVKEKLRQIKPQITELTQKLETQTKQVQSIHETIISTETKLKTQTDQLPKDLPDVKSYQTKVKDLTSTIERYDQDLTGSSQKLDEAVKQLDQINNQLESHKTRATELNGRFKKVDQFLNDQCVAQNVTFDQLSAWMDQLANLPVLTEDVQRFKQTLAELNGQLKQATQSIKDKELPNLQHLLEEQTKAERATKDANDRYHASENLIQANQKLVDEINRVLDQVTDQITKADHFGELAEVANGKGAQRLSLERYVLQRFLLEVLENANVRLRTLTDGRYQFKLDNSTGSSQKRTGLEINIYDDHAGKVRSVHTLSGGESFIAALALALALAEVIQNQSGGIEIEALFIDEGFGSLDEDSLMLAMNTLESIEGKNRMIGIISHVSELQAQVPDQLQVIADGKGESHIQYQVEI